MRRRYCLNIYILTKPLKFRFLLRLVKGVFIKPTARSQADIQVKRSGKFPERKEHLEEGKRAALFSSLSYTACCAPKVIPRSWFSNRSLTALPLASAEFFNHYGLLSTEVLCHVLCRNKQRPFSWNGLMMLLFWLPHILGDSISRNFDCLQRGNPSKL